MPIDIRARITFQGKEPLSDSEAGRAASFFIQHPGNPSVSPRILANSARAQEAAGYDSSLVWQFGASPDVWSVASWALSATDHLRVVAAHRPGVQAPTAAARTLATLDRLSNGRQQVHIIQGRTDIDIARDGDFLEHDARYRRAAEYVTVLKKELFATDPFDFDGEFYKVTGAMSGVQPIQNPHPTIHAAGNSDVGLDFVTDHAQVWAVGALGLAEHKKQIKRVTALAASKGQTLGYWSGGFNVILADTDEQAWDFALDISREVIDFLDRSGDRIADWEQRVAGSARALRQAREIPPEAFDFDDDGRYRVEGPLYTRLSALTGHGPSLVGTPDSIADYLAGYYRAGVGVITLGGVPELFDNSGEELLDAHRRQLRKELIAQLRARAGRIDRERNAEVAA